MSVELFRRARRAEATAERAEDRRRLRLAFFRQALTQGFDSLKVRHAEGASGQESVRAHATLMDEVIFSLTRLIADDSDRARLDATPLVVVALGGYGRRELHPLSDIDLMVVYDGELSPYVQRMMQELLYSLWDLGLQVGHSLRSLDDCVAMARTDFPSRTSMQEARFLAGDRRLFARFRRVLRENVYRRDFGQFLDTTLGERDQRYRRFGASPYIGEPNVKESAGGLRDVHTAMWLGEAKFGARTLRELADKGLITPREQAGTDAALTFLWRVRNELHFFSGHKNDVLGRDVQPRKDERLVSQREPRDHALVVVRHDPRVDDGAGFEATEERPQVEAVGQRPGAALGDYPPVVHQDHRVREPHDLLDRVAHVNDQDAQLVAQPLDVGEDLALALGVELRERLVHEQEARLREEGAADRDALPLAPGEASRSPVGQVADAE